VAGGAARRLGVPARPLRAGRVPRYDNAAELFPFLRANALARGETSPVLRILHSWIALEYLAREDAGSNGNGSSRQSPPVFSPRLEGYLPPHLASVAALDGMRAQLVAGWSAVRALALRSERRVGWMEIEAWLGTAGGHPRSLASLVGLLRTPAASTAPAHLEPGAPAALAAAFLRAVTADVGPFAGRRLETLGRQFDKGSRLAKTAEGIQVRTLIAVARLKLARHLAVHQGFNAAQASPPLALSAVQVLQSAFEVLRRWLRPGAQASEALAEARRWHEGNLASWRSTADLTLDADHLVHPLHE